MPEPSKDILISEADIASRIEEMAADINRDQDGRPLVVVGVLKGSFIFLADLVRKLTCPVICEFIRVSMTDSSTDEVRRIEYNVSFDVTGKDVLIVEDIFDTGITVNYLLEHFHSKSPNSVKVCALLNKQEAHKVDLELDYKGFDIPRKFVVGYGLDYDERYRELPYITTIEGITWTLDS